MKRYVEKKDSDITYELTPWVGILFSNGTKGIVVYIGGERYHIITNDVVKDVNIAYGSQECDGVNILDTINKAMMSTKKYIKIKTIFCADTYGELICWFSELSR
jgi:hypothetical protein